MNYSESQYHNDEDADEKNRYIHHNIGEFVTWLLSEKHKKYTVIAHNGRGYDFHFILKHLIEKQELEPFTIYQGGHLMYMTVGKGKDQIRFIDSLSFLTMPLAKFPKTFGLTAQEKGYYPHYWNTAKNANYNGKMPPMSAYGVDTMKEADREKFIKWYRHRKETNDHFNQREEIAKYCHMDVSILRQGCTKFRESFLEFGVDPFQYVTIASCCMALYRGEFMPKDSIAVIPNEKGFNTSREELEWLIYIQKKKGIQLQHALNGGQKIITVDGHNYRLDGWDEKTLTAYEYHGCYFHGCKDCHAFHEMNTKLNVTMSELLRRTKRRKESLLASGEVKKVVEIWGCQWKAQRKKNDTELTVSQFLDNIQKLWILSNLLEIQAILTKTIQSCRNLSKTGD